MLVLSRKQNERILFPNLGVAIEVLRIAGNTVRVGVEAPSEVKVLRSEVAGHQGIQCQTDNARKQRHELRNRVHTANLALHLVQKQLDALMFTEAENTLQRALDEFSKLDALVGQPLATAVPSVPKHRALLVEDNAQERALLAGYLRLSGYEVDVVQDGLEALQFLNEHSRPDLVLLDMQMPRMDGRATLSAIRRNPAYRGLKVFAVSGSDRQTMEFGNQGRGVDRWFSKPLNPDLFVGELNRELECIPAATV